MQSDNTNTRATQTMEPASFWRFFREISAIPRPSGQEKAVSDYLFRFAQERDLECWQDAIGNIVMIREASRGREGDPAVILQGHMDMVCETAPGCTKDMEKEGPELVFDGDWVSARGTTLGGDDGFAVACALAILDDASLSLPRLEFICTVSEETGMNGAREIDLSDLRGRTMINLDSETEGELLAGCAGGGRVRAEYPVTRTAADGKYLSVRVGGLVGGHSGQEIDKGRGNAVLLLTRILRGLLSEAPCRLVSLTGGSKDNAIPREACAVIAVPEDRADAVRAKAAELADAVRSEYSAADPGLFAKIENTDDTQAGACSEAETRSMLALLSAMPNGVVRMSDHVPGLVETSLSLGICDLEEDCLRLTWCLRSSVGTAYEELASRMVFIGEQLGARMRRDEEYPAWEFRPESPLREKMVRIFREMFGYEPRVAAIHAGVECGLLSGKLPGLDAVSIGPDMQDIHTPDERMSIPSVARTYEYVVRVLSEA